MAGICYLPPSLLSTVICKMAGASGDRLEPLLSAFEKAIDRVQESEDVEALNTVLESLMTLPEFSSFAGGFGFLTSDPKNISFLKKTGREL